MYLIDKDLCFLLVPVVSTGLVDLDYFRGYYIKGLNSRRIIFFVPFVLGDGHGSFFLGHGAIVYSSMKDGA